MVFSSLFLNELKAYDDDSKKDDKFLQTKISESFRKSALKTLRRDFAFVFEFETFLRQFRRQAKKHRFTVMK